MSIASTRVIAHQAIRERLAQVTIEQVLEHGYDQVTLHDLSAAAGVSRSTLLRYVGSKADAVVSGLMAIGDDIAARFRERPLDEDLWTALRRSLDLVVDTHGSDETRNLALVREVSTNSALSAALWQQRTVWQDALAAAIVARDGRTSRLRAETFSALALACLDVATQEWVGSEGMASFADLLDASFEAAGHEFSSRG